jgi:anti-sigma factor RsiW
MNESLHDDVEAYALGALDATEAAGFERHLAGCVPCQREVASYAPVMRALDTVRLPEPAAHAPAVGRAAVSRGLSPWRGFAIAASVALIAGSGYAGGVLRVHDEDATALAVSGMIAGASEDVHVDRGDRHLRVLVGARGERTAFVLAGLPAPPAGRAYQVWVDGRSPGMLRPGRNGTEMLLVPGDRVRTAHRIGVSEEPAEGSPHRTTPSLIFVTRA